MNPIKEKLEKLREEYTNTAREEFKNGTKELFINNSDLKSFSFKAYTDYFNDGDTCEYNVHSDYPDINEISGVDIDYDEEYEYLKPLKEKVSEFLQQFDDDIYKDIFGDHIEVTVYPDRIVSDSYEDHD